MHEERRRETRGSFELVFLSLFFPSVLGQKTFIVKRAVQKTKEPRLVAEGREGKEKGTRSRSITRIPCERRRCLSPRRVWPPLASLEEELRLGG